MKTRERTVHFYEILMESFTRSKEITRPSCADIGEILARIQKSKICGRDVVKGKLQNIEVTDWAVDPSNAQYYLLLNRTDRDVSDVTFKDIGTRVSRKGNKTATEGLEVSSHILIKPNSDGRSALVLMTMGSGIGANAIEQFFNLFTYELGKETANAHLFKFPKPSGECDSKGEPVTYKVNYKFECVAHKSSVLDDTLRSGKFLSFELISHGSESFDSGGNLHIEATSVLVKSSNPQVVTVGSMSNSILNFRRSSQIPFEKVRVRFTGSNGKPATTTLDIDALSTAFTRKDIIFFASDVESQSSAINATVIDGLKALI